MKIRIKGNSIRYRLSKSEVKQLCEKKVLEETTQFLNNTFKYAIVPMNTDELFADFKDNTITLYFPEKETETWYTSDLITYKNEVPLQHGEKLSLLLEKDFVCLDHTDEDQSDNYPNPSKVC